MTPDTPIFPPKNKWIQNAISKPSSTHKRIGTRLKGKICFTRWCEPTPKINPIGSIGLVRFTYQSDGSYRPSDVLRAITFILVKTLRGNSSKVRKVSNSSHGTMLLGRFQPPSRKGWAAYGGAEKWGDYRAH